MPLIMGTAYYGLLIFAIVIIAVNIVLIRWVLQTNKILIELQKINKNIENQRKEAKGWKV